MNSDSHEAVIGRHIIAIFNLLNMSSPTEPNTDIVLPTLNDNPLLLTVEQAAETLAVGRAKIYDLIRDDDLRSIQIGKSRRIPVSALHDFVGRQLLEDPEF